MLYFLTHLCHRFLPAKASLLGRDCSNTGKVEVSVLQEVDELNALDTLAAVLIDLIEDLHENLVRGFHCKVCLRHLLAENLPD